MWLDEDGWIDQPWVHRIPCSNHDPRPLGTQIDSLVIHSISLPERVHDFDAVKALFLNQLDCTAHPEYAALEGLHVSSHFVIDRQGDIYQFVSCDRRAWHAGVSAAMDRQNFNHFSLGIELIGDVYCTFEQAQYDSLFKLIAELRNRYPLKYGFAHSDIAPTRKTDPGPFFDWKRIRQSYTYELLPKS